ncbi:ABC transporter substrate-binding protein [Spirochaetia bacterium]|nr:ABC transporter substrate-binding protein [Spirochaetia bacterium]
MKKKMAILGLIALIGIPFAVFAGGTKDTRTPLTYLAWNLGTEQENNLERRMLTAFAAAHPDVNLTVLEVPKNADGTNGSYDNYITTLASQSNLPDVYMWTNVVDTAGAGWAYNVSDYALKDKDFTNIMATLRESSKINGHVYAIPYAMHYFGIAVNLSIFEELNVEPLPFNYTINQLREKIAAATTNKYKGIDNFAIEDWGAFTINSSLGYATFDGTKYNFTSDAYAQAISIYRDIAARGQTGNGSIVEPASWLPEGAGWAWGEGYVALQYEATWSLGGFVNGERPFKADLYPLPGEKVVIVPDFIYIGANTKTPELSYELAKWMSYGEAGQKQRVALAKANNFTLSGLPLAPGAYPEVDTFYLQSYQSLPNFTRLYKLIQEKPENAILESFKVVPGFNQSRFVADTGVLGTVNGVEKSLTISELIMSIVKGERQLADYAAEMERIANSEYQKALTLVRNK